MQIFCVKFSVSKQDYSVEAAKILTSLTGELRYGIKMRSRLNASKMNTTM